MPSDRGSTAGVDDLAQHVKHLDAALEGLGQGIVPDRQIADLRRRQTTRPTAKSPAPRGERP